MVLTSLVSLYLLELLKMDIKKSTPKTDNEGFWIGDKYITPMESEVEPHEKSMSIPEQVLVRWREVVRMNFSRSIDQITKFKK